MSDTRVHSFCPDHGINCKIDDDGTCSSCGASAVGKTGLDEIERLRDDLEQTCEKKDSIIWTLRQRIEELEEALEQVLDFRTKAIDEVIAGGGVHLVTYKQIDAAWKWIHMQANEKVVRGGEIALRELGIVRCDHLKASQINGELVDPKDFEEKNGS